MLRLPPILGRDFLLWCALPCAGAIMMVSLFALPNYLRADKLRNDAQLLRAVTDETIIAQENLRKLTTVVTQLRDERTRRCRPLGDGTDRDRLLSAITRPTDGTVVREQSIRTGQVVPSPGMPSEYQVLRREVVVEMEGTFDAIFGVLDAAEGIDQLITVRSLEISVIAPPIEQAQTGTAIVRATIVFEEWFQPANTGPTASTPRAPAVSPLALLGGAR